LSEPFEINRETRAVMVGGTPTSVGARAFDVLAYLDTHRDRVVSKAELLDHVWGGLAVEEGNLTVQISTLRKLLGARTISTVPGVGYKLTGDTSVSALKSGPAPQSGPALPDIPSLAVLPFANLTRSADNDYLVDGIVSDLVSALSRLPGIFVIASSSSFKYKGRVIDLADVGRELGVRYVLEGSIQMGGQRLRITSQLVEAETGHTLWTERFEGSTEDVFELQDKITERTASALEVNLMNAEADRARDKPTASLKAYDLSLQAAPLVFRITDRAAFETVIALLDQALALDPDYSRAQELKMRAYMMACAARVITYAEGREGLEVARALLANPQTDANGLTNAGHYMAYLGGEPELGYRTLQRAITLNPNSAMALSSAVWVAAYLGRYTEAIEHYAHGARLNPLHPNHAHSLAGYGYALMGLGRYDQSIAALEDSIADDPSFGSSHWALMIACELAGHHDRAAAICMRYRAHNPQSSVQYYLENTPFKDKAMGAKFKVALRQLGIPEVGP
jgi:TolB-like protein